MSQIYPRDVLSKQQSLVKQAFLMMPFDNRLDETYAAIINACEKSGIKCVRADSLYNPTPILTNIVELIGKSQVLIADLTGKNPNVFYEIGISHAARRSDSIILISQSMDDVPFDLRHLPILIYSPENLVKLTLQLTRCINESLATTDGLRSIHLLAYGLDRNHKQTEAFIDYLAKSLPYKIEKIARILDERNLAEGDFEDVYFSILHAIDSATEENKNYLQFLAMSLFSTNYAIKEKKDFVQQQLRPILTPPDNPSLTSKNSVIAQFCFGSISSGFLKTECIQWLISYLCVPKVGNVDFVRSRIEFWLSENSDNEVEVALLGMLSSTIPHMRESAADILGIRMNVSVRNHIAAALSIETDPYAGRSLINALGRLGGGGDSAKIVENWIMANSAMWNTDHPKSPTLPLTAMVALKKMGQPEAELKKFEAAVLSRRR